MLQKKIRAFWLGIKEASSDCTTHFDDWGLLECYDHGRNVGRFLLRMED